MTTSEYLLVFRNTGWHKDLSSKEIQQNIARFTEWFERLNNAGLFKDGGPLGRDGKTLAGRNAVTDGPFAESKEVVGGFSIIQAETLSAAAKHAKGCPGLLNGGKVEVRRLAGYTAKN